MKFFWNLLWSSVGRKFINAVTGLALCSFIVVHLAGNIALLIGARETFNRYSHFLLHQAGTFVYFAEALLVLIFLLHIIAGVSVWWNKLTARPVGYQQSSAAGPPSHRTFSSETMIYTGAIILVFTVLHILTFKFGPGVEAGYAMEHDGVVMRDLYQLGIDVFHQPVYVIWYLFSMVALGFHLRHGFWSAFQSLGLNHPRYIPVVTGFGFLFAVVMAFGFLVIPLVIYFRGGVS